MVIVSELNQWVGMTVSYTHQVAPENYQRKALLCSGVGRNLQPELEGANEERAQSSASDAEEAAFLPGPLQLLSLPQTAETDV